MGIKHRTESDLPQLDLNPVNCQLLCDTPAEQTLNTAKQGLDLGHCREAGEHASKNIKKSYPRPHAGLIRSSKKHQGLKHVRRWVLQAHPMEARNHGAQCVTLVLTWHLPPLPLPPGGLQERHTWGAEAVCNMPIAEQAGTLLLASVFFMLSAAFALICRGGNCDRAPGDPQSSCEAPRCLQST